MPCHCPRLHLSRQLGHGSLVTVVTVFVRQAAADTSDGKGHTHHMNHFQLAAILINAGAKVDATDGTYGWTPMHWAACAPPPMHWAACAPPPPPAAAAVPILGCAAFLSLGGASNDGVRNSRVDGRALVPLRSTDQGHNEVVRLLLQRGADPRATDKVSGETPLHLAALGGHLETCKVLVNTPPVKRVSMRLPGKRNQEDVPLHLVKVSCGSGLYSLRGVGVGGQDEAGWGFATHRGGSFDVWMMAVAGQREGDSARQGQAGTSAEGRALGGHCATAVEAGAAADDRDL